MCMWLNQNQKSWTLILDHQNRYEDQEKHPVKRAKKSNKCSNCGILGHNRKKCKNPALPKIPKENKNKGGGQRKVEKQAAQMDKPVFLQEQASHNNFKRRQILSHNNIKKCRPESHNNIRSTKHIVTAISSSDCNPVSSASPFKIFGTRSPY